MQRNTRSSQPVFQNRFPTLFALPKSVSDPLCIPGLKSIAIDAALMGAPALLGRPVRAVRAAAVAGNVAIVSVPRTVGAAAGEIPSEMLGAATRVNISAERTLALLPSNGGSGPLRWQLMSSAPRLHGNSLLATGPHGVYAMVDRATGRVLHFGETGRGAMTRGTEWRRYFQGLGIDTDVVPLRTVQGKAAARAMETRYIDTYERLFGSKPEYNLSRH